MTYKWLIQRLIKKLQSRENTIDSEKCEPLDHPELSRMTLAELADLPMPAYIKENCTGRVRKV